MLSDCHTHLEAWGEEERSQLVAAAHPQVFAAVAVHPWNPEPWDQNLYLSLTGNLAQLRDWLDLGFSISAGWGLLRPEASPWEAVVRQIPEDRLLLETDAYPGPSVAGEAPGPAGVKTVAQRVPQLRQTTVEAGGRRPPPI